MAKGVGGWTCGRGADAVPPASPEAGLEDEEKSSEEMAMQSDPGQQTDAESSERSSSSPQEDEASSVSDVQDVEGVLEEEVAEEEWPRLID